MHLTAEIDPLIVGLIVGILGALLWVVTNWHLVRVGRALKADIDEKRAETEAFVREELKALKAEIPSHDFEEDLVALKAEIKAEIEGNTGLIQEEVRAFYADFSGFAEKLGGDVARIPELISLRLAGLKGESQKVLQTALAEQGQDFEGEITMMEAVASENPEVIIGTAMKKVADWTPSAKFLEEHELIALAAEVGKPMILGKMAEFFEGTLGKKTTRGRGPRDQKALPTPFGR